MKFKSRKRLLLEELGLFLASVVVTIILSNPQWS